jgi:hypothetical protein
MLVDYLVSILQVIAFGFIAFGCVLCLWAVVLDAQEADTEATAPDTDRRSSPDQRVVVVATCDDSAGKTAYQALLPMTMQYGVRQSGSIKIR